MIKVAILCTGVARIILCDIRPVNHVRKRRLVRILCLNIIVGITLCTQYYARRDAYYKHIVCVYIYIYVRVGRLQTINRVVAEVFIYKKKVIKNTRY